MPDSEDRDYEPADRLLERILSERRAQWESQEKRRGKYKEPIPPDTTDRPKLPARVGVGDLRSVGYYRNRFATKGNAVKDGITIKMASALGNKLCTTIPLTVSW